MIRRCEPLYDGDTGGPFCGAVFDDLYRMAVCPHVSLAGGDTVGIVPPPPDYVMYCCSCLEAVEEGYDIIDDDLNVYCESCWTP